MRKINISEFVTLYIINQITLLIKYKFHYLGTTLVINLKMYFIVNLLSLLISTKTSILFILIQKKAFLYY